MTLPLLLAFQLAALSGGSWKRHTIDAGSRGADGVKLYRSGEGRPLIATAWEEGGEIRVYTPRAGGYSATTAGRVGSPEDALLVDLDGDGAVDVVSSCEGETRSIFVHWGPDWNTEAIPVTQAAMKWMFAAPMPVAGRRGANLIAGGRGPGAKLGILEAPANPRNLAAWRWRPLRDVGWTMSIIHTDMDGDGDGDILFSDRKGDRTGVFWLENPSWKEHGVGSFGREAMFLDYADFDGDGSVDVIVPVKPHEVQVHLRKDRNGRKWTPFTIPVAGAGTAKAVRIADLDLDGQADVLVSSEQTRALQSGVMYLKREGRGWRSRDVSGPEGVKFDLMELVDMDGDGDLDVITTEERRGLGVIWYENPARRR